LRVWHWEGSGPSVLLVHGAGGHGRWLDPWARALNQWDLDVRAVDLSGHGESSGARGAGSVAQWANDVVTAAGTAARVDLVCGTGWGCVVAYAALVRHPDTLPRAFLHACVLPEVFRRARALVPLARKTGEGPEVPLRVVQPWERLAVDLTLRRTLMTDPKTVHRYPLRTVMDVLTARAAWPPAGNVQPVTVCAGERDRLFPWRAVVRTFTGMGGPRHLHVLTDEAHASWAESPQILADATVDALDRP
jgi:pimeloyl-ACP methyl ester carboxylesterase